MPFVHLHVHSHFSLRKGLASPAELARAAAEKGMTALALTDQDSLAGMSEHLRACKEHGLKPIVGAELSVLFPAIGKAPVSIHHLTVLVETEAGYRNLVRLLNVGRRHRTPKMPFAVPLADFTANSRGLILLTGCHASRLYNSARNRQVEEALSHIQALIRAAGRERVYMEILPPAHETDEVVNRRLLELAAYAQIPPVVTQNVCYIKKGDHLGEFVLAHARVDNENWAQWVHVHRTRHMCDEAEMHSMFGWREEIINNTDVVAGLCRFAAPSTAQHFPMQVLSRGDEPEAVLWEKALTSLGKLASGNLEIRLKERLNREIGLIRQAKLAPYFLLLHELANELDQNGVVRGPAQGIWQSSATAYSLGLAQLDPASFRLSEPNWLEQAERFPIYRFELAEWDQERAAELITARVGKFMVGRVGRWATLRRSLLLKQLAQQVGASEAKLTRLLAERPRPVRQKKGGKHTNGNGNGHAIEEGLKVDDAVFLRKAADLLGERPMGLRADGVMLAFSGQDMEDTVPLAEISDAGLTTQIDEEGLDFIGVPRTDLISSSLMTVISWATRAIREQIDPKFSLAKIPLDDAQTFALLGQAQTNCIGELHSISAKALLRTSPPTSLLELAALLRKRRRRDVAVEEEATADLSPVLPAALITYWAAWLKCHHPLAFMSGMLTRNLSNAKRFAIVLREARRLKIQILPPDITVSRFHFAPEKGNIRTGLIIVRQLGERAYEELDRERKSRPFDDIVDFCRRTDSKTFTNRIVANLVKVGAMDRFDQPRSHHLAMIDDIFRDLKAERDQEEDRLQPTLFDLDTLELKRPGSDVRLDEVPEFDTAQLLAYEREAAGYIISADTFKTYELLMKRIHAVSPYDLRRRDAGREAHVVGYIDHVEWDSQFCGSDAVALLDCEGAIVRVARGAKSFIGAELDSSDPVLIGGMVRRNGDETYLEAHSIFSLEETYRLSMQVARIILDVQGEDKRTLKDLAALVKSYSGKTLITLAKGCLETAPSASRLDKATTFFCPPVYLALVRYLTRERIQLQDKEGNPVEIPAPALIS